MTPTPEAREPLWSRLGIPSLTGSGKYVSATTIDSLGTGLILAFTVVYFAETTSVSLAAIGTAMTVARLLALPTSVTVGPLIDRFTARRTAAMGNVVSAVGYTGFLFTSNALSIGLVVFLVQLGHTTYWTSNGALVALAAPEDQRQRWFGFVHALRNSGMGIGGALGAFAYGIGNNTGLHLITIANAGSFLLAALLLLSWHPAPHGPAPAAEDGAGNTGDEGADQAVGYKAVLRDRPYTLLVGVNVTLVFAQMLIKILLAIYIVEALDKGAWIAGTLIVLATVQVALLQTVTSRRMERHRATRVIAGAGVLNAVSFGLFAALYAAPGWMVVGGLFVAMCVFTMGEIVGFPAIDSLSVSMAPERTRGRYLAVYQLSWTVGEVVAPSLFTFLLARGAVLPMVFLMALSLLAIPLLLVLERSTDLAVLRPAAVVPTPDAPATDTPPHDAPAPADRT